MIAGILKEYGIESRVALLPDEAAGLKKLGIEVLVENNAGENAFTSDEEYMKAGAIPSSRNCRVISNPSLHPATVKGGQ